MISWKGWEGEVAFIELKPILWFLKWFQCCSFLDFRLPNPIRFMPLWYAEYACHWWESFVFTRVAPSLLTRWTAGGKWPDYTSPTCGGDRKTYFKEFVDRDWIWTDRRPKHACELKYTYRDDDRWWHWSIMRALGGQNVAWFTERFAELVRWTLFPVNNMFSNHTWLRERLWKIMQNGTRTRSTRSRSTWNGYLHRG